MGLRRVNVATCEEKMSFVAVGANWMPCPGHVSRALVSWSACPPKFRVTAYTLGNGHSGHLVLVCITILHGSGVFRRSAVQIHSSSVNHFIADHCHGTSSGYYRAAFCIGIYTHGLSDQINP
jgi:hypothetical protein